MRYQKDDPVEYSTGGKIWFPGTVKEVDETNQRYLIESDTNPAKPIWVQKDNLRPTDETILRHTFVSAEPCPLSYPYAEEDLDDEDLTGFEDD